MQIKETPTSDASDDEVSIMTDVDYTFHEVFIIIRYYFERDTVLARRFAKILAESMVKHHSQPGDSLAIIKERLSVASLAFIQGDLYDVSIDTYVEELKRVVDGIAFADGFFFLEFNNEECELIERHKRIIIASTAKSQDKILHGSALASDSVSAHAMIERSVKGRGIYSDDSDRLLGNTVREWDSTVICEDFPFPLWPPACNK